jgi:hypothetical protein
MNVHAISRFIWESRVFILLAPLESLKSKTTQLIQQKT